MPSKLILTLHFKPIHRCGFGVGCSAGKLFKSLKAGFEPEDIIFDGQKTDFDLVRYHAEDSPEMLKILRVEFINDYSNKGLNNIGIRINPILMGTMDKITTGLSEIGISIDQIDFDTL